MTSPQPAAPTNIPPSASSLSSNSPDKPAPRYAEIALLALCVFLFFFRLGSVPLFDLDEGVYVTCARNMAVSNNWITPTLNSRPMLHPDDQSVPFFEKPILVYWCGAASMKLLGISEFAARLPAARWHRFSPHSAYTTRGGVGLAGGRGCLLPQSMPRLP